MDWHDDQTRETVDAGDAGTTLAMLATVFDGDEAGPGDDAPLLDPLISTTTTMILQKFSRSGEIRGGGGKGRGTSRG